MKRRLFTGLFAVGAIAAAFWWWTGRQVRPNVLLITLDTTRADHLGCYGDAAAQTPHLDSIAAAGTLFEHAYTVVPITLPAHATLLTGLLPPEHGLRINGTSRLPEGIPTLAELLSDDGYRTGAFVSSLVLDSQFGLDRGFETYNDSLSNMLSGPRAERPAEETVTAALSWLKGLTAEPSFCWVHLYDPHDPYDPHVGEFGDQFADAPYRGEIAYMDRHIGRLLEWLRRSGKIDSTIVIVVGDHGEGLMEHNERTHGYLTYNSTLHVPLMIHDPDSPGGRRIAEPVSIADVFPTMLERLQFDISEDRHERSFLTLIEGDGLSPRPCYAESEAPYIEGGWSPLRTWVTSRWKYIRSAEPELYDLSADPHETDNVLAAHGDEADRLDGELADFEASLPVRAGVVVAASQEQLKALRGLGYVGGNAPEEQPDRPPRNIKDILPFIDQVHECRHLIDDNEAAQAQQILEAVVAELPEYSMAWATLGVSHAVQRQYAEAEKCYRTALDLDGHQNFARIGLGRALYETDHWEACVEELEEAVAIEPSSLDAQFYLGEARRRLGRWDQARQALTAAITTDPDFSDGYRALADVDRDAGNLSQAVQCYQQALTLDGTNIAAAINCSRVLVILQRTRAAIDLLEQYLRISPNQIDGLSELAILLATTSDLDLRNPERCVALAERASQLADRQSPQALRALAAGQAASDQLSDAIETATEALAVARTGGQQELKLLAEAIEAELRSYRERQASAKDSQN